MVSEARLDHCLHVVPITYYVTGSALDEIKGKGSRIGLGTEACELLAKIRCGFGRRSSMAHD